MTDPTTPPPDAPEAPAGNPPSPADTENALLAASTAEHALDPMHDAIYSCLVQSFDDQGLNHISSPQMKIVWSTIDEDVVTFLGDAMRDCIRAKGFLVPGLAGPFRLLRENKRVTVVDALVEAIESLTTERPA